MVAMVEKGNTSTMNKKIMSSLKLISKKNIFSDEKVFL